MHCEPVTINDLDEIRNLRPEGWNDIVPSFKFYIESEFCFPVKVKVNNCIAGIGSLIIFENTSWMAHIIVRKDFRRRGIGFQIVIYLLEKLNKSSIRTCSLIASELGKPVYEKTGFRYVAEYCFMERKKTQRIRPASSNIVSFNESHRSMIYELDKRISGENRERLLTMYLENSVVYMKNKNVLGFYIPDLGEGLIIADSDEAGTELMNLKYSNIDKAVLPYENTTGIKFLKENGFAEINKKGIRMIYGEELEWQPKKIFGRIGGNLG